MSSESPILVTGAAGNIGAVGRSIVEMLRKRNKKVRALVHRLDQRSEALSALGAEIVVADLTSGADIVRALAGCRRMYFGMSASQPYLQATITAAAAAREIADFEVLVNISQMTVSQMTLTNMTESHQQQFHWLGEQALNWSGVPVVHVRATVFMEHPFFSLFAAASIAENGTIRLPFASARTSPISAYDVARVVATILEKPSSHVGKVYELTGPRSQDMNAIAQEYAEALKRPVKYVDVPYDQWLDRELKRQNLPEHVFEHFRTMAKLHAENRYDRLTNDVVTITGERPIDIREFVNRHPEIFRNAAYEQIRS
ncbi:MAG: hydroxylase [Candidatus Melainabacteria bacterium]|nr:MAG: hydroxylase [Candidatus Melainabacteria bacterium]